MVVIMLKNWSRRYNSDYIIKFVGFMMIYVINVDIISYFMVFNNLYHGSINLLQV